MKKYDYKGANTHCIGEETVPLPDVLINAWNEIWQMPEAEFGSPRLHHTDFEVYDERAAYHQNIVLDIYRC